MKYHVEKSIVIDADLKKVKSIVEDFNSWHDWSPWNVCEPESKLEVEGNAGEAGHKMMWDGELLGSGYQVITANKSNKILFDLQFTRPNKWSSKVAFDFEETPEGTKVTWILDGSMPFFLFFFVHMMEMMIGMDFTRGLRMLKTVAEGGKIKAVSKPAGVAEFEGFKYVGIKRRATMDDMANSMSDDFSKIIDDFVKSGVSAKHWVAIYPKVHPKTEEMTYIAAISAENIGDMKLPEGYVTGEIKSGKAFEVKHHGSYYFLGNAWSIGMMHVRGKKMKQNGSPFEYYWNSPYDVEPDDLETSIYFPVKS